jgi:hypothetical protein
MDENTVRVDVYVGQSPINEQYDMKVVVNREESGASFFDLLTLDELKAKMSGLSEKHGKESLLKYNGCWDGFGDGYLPIEVFEDLPGTDGDMIGANV